jgi:D-methionine transport system substrate-binding protein
MRGSLINLFFVALLTLCACSNNEPRTIKIAATPVPHAQILKEIEPELNRRGIKLRIIEVDDYTSANRLLNEGQVDANFFQHRPYLKQQEEQFGYQFEELVPVHIEPLGVYSTKYMTIEDLPLRRLIAIPSDPSNQSRALFLLQDAGLIELENTLAPTLHDLKSNPYQIRLREIDAPFLARTLRDVDFAVIPSNFALQARLNPLKDALLLEDANSPYVNIIVIRKGDTHEKLEVLKFVIQSPQTHKMIEERYQGAIRSISDA